MAEPQATPDSLHPQHRHHHPHHNDVEKIAADILSANLTWARRMNQVYQEYFPDPKEKQTPNILWIGCADSRVLDSDMTEAKPGKTVFVHRNIANQFHLDDDNALSVLAYALKALQVQHVVVVGHSHCGGAITAMKEAGKPPQADNPHKRHHKLFDSLYHEPEHHPNINDIHDEQSQNPSDALTRWLSPLVEHVRELALPLEEEAALEIVIEENVKLQVENLAQLDNFVRTTDHVKKPVWVHGWVYDFSTGFFKDLHITRVLGAK